MFPLRANWNSKMRPHDANKHPPKIASATTHRQSSAVFCLTVV